MRSHSFRIDKRRRTYVRLLGEVQHALTRALEEEHERRGLTMAEIARILGVSRSDISRKMRGERNMTLETLADLAYALDRPVRVSLPARTDKPGANDAVARPYLSATLSNVGSVATKTSSSLTVAPFGTI